MLWEPGGRSLPRGGGKVSGDIVCLDGALRMGALCWRFPSLRTPVPPRARRILESQGWRAVPPRLALRYPKIGQGQAHPGGAQSPCKHWGWPPKWKRNLAWLKVTGREPALSAHRLTVSWRFR